MAAVKTDMLGRPLRRLCDERAFVLCEMTYSRGLVLRNIGWELRSYLPEHHPAIKSLDAAVRSLMVATDAITAASPSRGLEWFESMQEPN